MIDPKQIQEASNMDLAAALHGPLQKFFVDPENQKAYEEWAAERREKK